MNEYTVIVRDTRFKRIIDTHVEVMADSPQQANEQIIDSYSYPVILTAIPVFEWMAGRID
jgi:hypothetical protein